MTSDFQKGLITGLAMQPLQVTTEHAVYDPDSPDIYNISFDAHNLLADTGIMSSGSWGNVTVDENIVTMNANGNVSTAWYQISNQLFLETNTLYKITASHARFYGRFAINSYGGISDTGDHKHMSCTCAYHHGDTHMLHTKYDDTGDIKSTIFMIVPHYEMSPGQNVNILWCTDVLYENAKEAFSVDLGLYKQII